MATQKTKGTLWYYLLLNPLIKNAEEYMARVSATDVYDVNRIAAEMQKYNSTATIADIKAVMEILFFVVSDKVANGCNVRLPIVNIRPSITGRFTSPVDSFDSNRHAINVKVTAGEMLNSSITNLQVSRYDSVERAPILKQFINCFTDSSAGYNAGFIGKVMGSELKFDTANSDEGLFFVNIESGAEVKVQHFGKITNAELMFTLPVLTQGEFVMEVRKAYCSDKEIRKGALKKTITIE